MYHQTYQKNACGCKVIDAGHSHVRDCYDNPADSFETPELTCRKPEYRIWYCPVHYRAPEMHELLKADENLANRESGFCRTQYRIKHKEIIQLRRDIINAIEKTS